MSHAAEAATSRVERMRSLGDLAKYEKPDTRKAVWQLVDTLIPYFGVWALMAYMLNHGVSYWLTLPLTVLAAGLLIRVFIFFHDCGHGCFFASRRANRFVGYITGVLTFTPFDDWRHQHALHHAGAGDLERRGAGDVWTMTVKEYLSASKARQFGYRLFRNPLVLFLLGPLFLFFIAHRVPHKGGTKREYMSVHYTNLGIAAMVLGACLLMGWKTYLLLQFPVMGFAGIFGVWLFYVQHQYEDVYWSEHSEWDPIDAALAGSSFYKLPKVLQWFSGNIGFHHIHHLRSRIPNYNLERCYNEVPAMQDVETLTFVKSLQSMFLNLWDESSRKMISFRGLQKYRHQLQTAE